MLENAVLFWSPSSEPEHEEDYRKVFQEWYPMYETVPGQIAAERRHVQELAELQAEQQGREFIVVKATPRFVRAKVAEMGHEFTEESAHLFLNILASLPGFERDKVYDLDNE